MKSSQLFRRTAATVAKSVDRVFAGTALNPPKLMRRNSSAEGLAPVHRMRGLGAISGFYNRPDFMPRHSALFPQPRAISPEIKRVRRLGDVGEVLDLHWDSAFVPLWTKDAVDARFSELTETELERLGMAGLSVHEVIAQIGLDKSGDLLAKYMRAKRNQRAHARWLRHTNGPRPRPCVVLLHGYMAGTYAIEERVWPVRQLFDSGMDVVITVLPFHGPRRSEARGYRPPSFPSSDPRFTIEGLRQLVSDHTALFDYLLDGRVSSLGVMGMSLGGYGSALLATLEPRLKFAVLVIPLAAIEEFAFTHGRFTGTEQEQQAQRQAMTAAQWTVSPLARPPLVGSERVVVLAGESDLVTGVQQARSLSDHFKTELEMFEGGHLLQFGRSRAFAPVWRMLKGIHAE
jgi:pimeloyl-ACP methyl ester carboxylesterase